METNELDKVFQKPDIGVGKSKSRQTKIFSRNLHLDDSNAQFTTS